VVLRLEQGPAAGEKVAARVSRGVPWPEVSIGAGLRIRGRLAVLARHESHLRRRAVHAALVVTGASATGTRRGGPAGALDAVRSRAERALGTGLQPPEAALLRGMVLGQDERIPEAVREDFRRSGLAHLLAVSGQNVMLLAALALPVAAALGLGLRGRLLVVLALIVLYVPLAGAGPSIQRAGVMGAAGIVAGLAGRPASRWYAVLLAGVATLAANPLAAGDPGWQLSFAAVVALLLWAPPLHAGLRRAGLPGPVAGAAALTLAATIGTAPLMAAHFGRLSPASLPANLIAAPAVAPCMWLGMASAALGQALPGAAALLNALNAPLLAFLQQVAAVAARAPHATVELRLGSAWTVAAAYAALAVASLSVARAARHGRPRRGAIGPAAALLVAAALVLLASSATEAERVAPGELVVSFLDVGQGDATLLRTSRSAVLVDTGPPAGPILRRLREAGVGGLDALVLSHASADHLGGAAEVLRAHPAALVLDGDPWSRSALHARAMEAARRGGARVVTASAGQELALGALRLRVLWPPARASSGPPPGADPNDSAVVALVRHAGLDVLLPADAESGVLRRLALGPVDVLKVAHHGSADPGLPALLGALRPRVAAIGVGADNTYGHPAPATTAALLTVPRVLRTDRDGTVTLRASGAGLAISTDP